ncbi:MAG: hypothetical protein PHR35_18715, partial [Kiritimatiellae bacterium]|nr:hypothetical protein [Kiritimatiellia bacterium]
MTTLTHTRVWQVALRCACLFGLCLVQAVRCAGAQRVYMEATGQAFKAIVIADKPSGAARLAAEELQHYLSKVTGGTTWELR